MEKVTIIGLKEPLEKGKEYQVSKLVAELNIKGGYAQEKGKAPKKAPVKKTTTKKK